MKEDMPKMLFQRTYGIDLGTSSVKIYDYRKDSIAKEKNMIAIRNKDTVFAVGNAAYEMFEKNPMNIDVITPMSNGRISDVILVEAILQNLLESFPSLPGYRPTLYFTVPAGTTEIEKRAYYSVAHRGKLRKCRVYLVEKPIADALALGIPLRKTKGSMIVNIGAESTELSVIADSRVIISKMVPLGGKQFNTAILASVRRKNSFQISHKTAKRLKLALTNLKGGQPEGRKVMGMDASTGLPRDGIVTSHTVTRAVVEELENIAVEMKKFLERTPPQVRANILKEGIYLSGGSTRMPGIDSYFAEALGCPVQLSQYYDLCTVCGLKELIAHPALHRWAFVPKRRTYE